ncbi:MAG: hypothetical protein IKJ39_00585 [Lachnospiraceae bacterium]|nr:hypothetical protein [Lachnospiraceae bacterium]MBR2402711.1 hypothetical protein [Lachnospiraceae bacterium]MBR3823675.1 hypothetical protein [Lachnospiraceae bacterium]MBR4083386.1 hypothetical protein [Lachnospiraceae bacterium]MBR6627997.1 hypothetical protein [Lachnospiraceae bacterium]
MSKLKNWLQKIGILREPTIDDLIYEYTISTCYRLFPTSFYRKHTPEEIKKAHEETLTELRRMIEEYKKENHLEDSV